MVIHNDHNVRYVHEQGWTLASTETIDFHCHNRIRLYYLAYCFCILCLRGLQVFVSYCLVCSGKVIPRNVSFIL